MTRSKLSSSNGSGAPSSTTRASSSEGVRHHGGIDVGADDLLDPAPQHPQLALERCDRLDGPPATTRSEVEHPAVRPDQGVDARASISRPPTKPRTRATRKPRSRRSKKSTAHIVGPLLAALQRQGEYRILSSPDHPTPLRTKTHSHGFVPLAIAGTGVTPDDVQAYHEPAAARSNLVFDEGWRLMRYFLELAR